MGQLAFPEPRMWGGRRKGAGRKRSGRPGVAHRARPSHVGRHPLHVTLRKGGGLVSLRRRDVFGAVRAAISRASNDSFRVIEYSVQVDHIHFIIEANDRSALLSGARGLSIRLARAINRALRRCGRVWADRWHARELRTPTEVRNALRYVLQNVRHHLPWIRGLDPCSSAPWFTGWRGLVPLDAESPVRTAQTWLLSCGWRRRGLLPP